MNFRLIGTALLPLLMAPAAYAITLQWAGGVTDIGFTSATRCTLLVAVAEPDTALPQDLRLSWVAQNCADIHVVADPTADPAGVESRVDEIVDRSELESRARFRNVLLTAPGPHSTSARYILELPAGAHGKIRAQAARPGGGIDVSNIVTFNSGVGTSFAPVVFNSQTTIEGNAVVVHARGVGLGASRGVRLVTADTTWSAHFDLTQQDDTSLTARNASLNDLPQAVLQVTNVNGDGSALASSAMSTPAAPTAFSGSVIVTDPNPSVVLKDFAFVYDVTRNPATSRWEGLYHLYYIRQKNGLGRVLAHQYSPDLVTWSPPDTTEFVAGAGGGAWDASEVWAPSLIKVGSQWHMFYTGVDAAGNQSMGYATKASLKPDGTPWQRRTTPVVTSSNVSYVDLTTPVQLRDPFAIEDPSLPGRFLMLYTAKNDPGQLLPAGYTIGVSRNLGNLDTWQFVGRYVDTDYDHAFDLQDESPHAFRDPNVTTHWRLMWTAAYAIATKSIHFLENAPVATLSSTAGGAWSSGKRLYDYTQQSVGYGWNGSEFLHTGDYLQASTGAAPYGYTDFLAGFLAYGPGFGIQISKLSWGSVISTFPTHQDFTLDLSMTGVGRADAGGARRPTVRAVSGVVRSPGVCAAVTLPNSEQVVIELLDVSGRVVRELLREKLPAGTWTISWDLKDASGASVRPGMFFLRLRSPSGEGATRFAVLR